MSSSCIEYCITKGVKYKFILDRKCNPLLHCFLRRRSFYKISKYSLNQPSVEITILIYRGRLVSNSPGCVLNEINKHVQKPWKTILEILLSIFL
jgi:hypothetical protein